MRCTPVQKNTRIPWIFAALLGVGGIAYAVPVVCEAYGVDVIIVSLEIFVLLRRKIRY